MSLTRKMLKAFGIEDNIIEQIIDAHTETTDSLKAERDRYKGEAERVEELQRELKKAQDDTKLNELREKYDEQSKALNKAQAEAEKAKAEVEKTKGEFDEYKSGVEEEKAKSAKEGAYRKLLEKANVNPKYVDVIVRATNLSDMELDENGELKDAEALSGKVNEDWSEFVMTEDTRGTNPPTPPSPDDVLKGANPLAVQIAKERHERLYGKSEE